MKGSQLEELPSEILTRIADSLEAKFVLRTFPLVSKRLNAVFTDEKIWQNRLNAKFPGRKLFPRWQQDSDSGWTRLCADLESETQLWSDSQSQTSFTTITGGHYASVDVVHILPKSELCFTGSRDRSISIWDLNKFPQESTNVTAGSARVFTKENAHKGWIWSLSASKDEQKIFTGCWDGKIKEWSLQPNGELLELTAIKCLAPVLCLSLEENCLYAGTFNKKLKIVDIRNGMDIAKPLTHHKAPVLSLAVEGNFIFSCGEDKTIAVIDKRTRRPLKIQKMSHYSLALSLGYGMLWAADVGGNIHRLDPMRGSLDLLMSHRISDCKLTDVKHTCGSVMAVSADGTVKVVNPYLTQPQMIGQLGPFRNGIPAKIDYQKDILACSFADFSIGIWKPNRS